MYCILFLLILFLLNTNYLIYKNNHFGGDYVDSHVSNSTILPIFNKGVKKTHDYIHKIFKFGELNRKIDQNKLNKIRYNRRKINEFMNVLNKTKKRNDIILLTSLQKEL